MGGYLGGFIDRSIFGSKARINQEGSRLTDLMVQASTYGKSIPVVYGNARIAGNVIWSRPIQEHVTTTTQSSGGGKGGGGGGSVENTTTTYTYTASLAVAICEGAISEVVRVCGGYSAFRGSRTLRGGYYARCHREAHLYWSHYTHDYLHERPAGDGLWFGAGKHSGQCLPDVGGGGAWVRRGGHGINCLLR